MSYSLMMQHREAGRQKCKDGCYSDAEQLFKLALQESEDFPSPNAYKAQQMKTLGVLYFALGKHDEAEPYFKSSLEIEKTLLGTEDLEICKSLNHLGLLYHIHGQFSLAERTYKKALAIAEKAPYKKQPRVDAKLHHLTLHLLAMVYCSEGRNSEAFALCQQAANKIGKNTGPGGKDISMGIHNVAVKYCDNDPNPEVRNTCGWLLHVFFEQLQNEFLGAVIKSEETDYQGFLPRKSMFASSHEVLATYDDVWRPAAIYRDEVLPKGYKNTDKGGDRRSSQVDARLSEVGEDSWRP